MHWNPVDILLLAIVLASAWIGWRRGFVVAALDLLTLAASLAVAFLGWGLVADRLARAVPSLGIWAAPASFLMLFLLVHLLLAMLVFRLLLHLPRKVHAHGLNRALGIAPGLVNGAVYAIVAAVLLLTLPLGPRVGGWSHQSSLAARLAAPAEWAGAQLAEVFDPALKRTMRLVIVGPDQREGVTLDFRFTHAVPRPDLEAQMLAMVNDERRAAGLKPLQPDPELTSVARAHSQDMLARGYFSHYTPEGRDLGDRLRAARVGYLFAGENLAFAANLYLAHQGLMHSPGHRANILRPQFGRLGVGILDAGEHGLMVTQAYRN